MMDGDGKHGWGLVAAGAGFAAAQDLQFGKPEGHDGRGDDLVAGVEAVCDLHMITAACADFDRRAQKNCRLAYTNVPSAVVSSALAGMAVTASPAGKRKVAVMALPADSGGLHGDFEVAERGRSLPSRCGARCLSRCQARPPCRAAHARLDRR